MRTVHDKELDVEYRNGLWFFRYRRRRLGPFESENEALIAGKKFLYLLYLARLRKAATGRDRSTDTYAAFGYAG
ncbi:MAG: hypothetical protein CL534_19700 [Ahrensia sp.]|nr:hypothetical protein [Ahrensia sp.]